MDDAVDASADSNKALYQLLDTVLCARKKYPRRCSSAEEVAVQDAALALLAAPACTFADLKLLMQCIGGGPKSFVDGCLVHPPLLRAAISTCFSCFHTGFQFSAYWMFSFEDYWRLLQAGVDCDHEPTQVKALHSMSRWWPRADKARSRRFLKKALVTEAAHRSLRSPGVALNMLRLFNTVSTSLVGGWWQWDEVCGALAVIVHTCMCHHMHDADVQQGLLRFLDCANNFHNGRIILLEVCVVQGQWHATMADDDLCKFVAAGGPYTFMGGRFESQIVAGSSKRCARARAEVVSVWTNVLRGRPPCVTEAWASGCSHARLGWVGEMVLMTLMVQKGGGAGACVHADVEAEYLSAIAASYCKRQHGVRKDLEWGEAACSVAVVCWARHFPHHVSNALLDCVMHILILANTKFDDLMFPQKPRALCIVHDALHLLPLSLSANTMKCVRAASSYFVKDKQHVEFMGALQTWVGRVLTVMPTKKLGPEVHIDFFHALYWLVRNKWNVGEDVLHSTLQHMRRLMAIPDVAREGRVMECAYHIIFQLLSIRNDMTTVDLSWVLDHVVVGAWFAHRDLFLTLYAMQCMNLLVVTYADADVDPEVFVSSHDFARNAKLFRVLHAVHHAVQPNQHLHNWLQQLLPSLFEPPMACGLCNMKQVRHHLVRARMFVVG
jgi:hypothetical protein